ncbi:MAG TPA: hypothetical protein VGW10_18955 [Solirubrobacteraceae bacterium]|nr:hypothetical protein [Solirubrobacteraceae bacterium]
MPNVREWLVDAIREGCPTPAVPPSSGTAQQQQPPPVPPHAEGEILWWLLTHRRWVRRRAERFELLDDRTVLRRMTVDIVLPARVMDHDVDRALTAVPITVLAKKKLRAFDLRGEEGQALPALSTPDNVRLATATLRASARSVLRHDAHPVTMAVLRYVAASDAKAAATVVKAFDPAAKLSDDQLARVAKRVLEERPRDAATGPLAPAVAEIRVLGADTAFTRLLEELAAGFVLLTPHVKDGTSRRRIVKLGYEEGFDPREGRRRWLRRSMGWAPSQVDFKIPGAARAASYHAEVLAPADAEILTASARAGADPDAADNEFNPGGRTHLHLVNADPQYEAPELRVELRARRSGLLHSAVVTCALAAALLAGGRLRLEQLAGQVEAAATLLLLVPGVLAAYVVRPGEHALVSSLLIGVRAMLLVAAGCAVAGGGLLLAGLQQSTRELLWTWLLLVALACFAGTAFSNLLPMRPRDESPR